MDATQSEPGRVKAMKICPMEEITITMVKFKGLGNIYFWRMISDKKTSNNST